MPKDIHLTVNGDPQTLPASSTVADLVEAKNIPTDGTAVAVHDRVVPASQWGKTELADGDHIEILTAVQGG